MYLYFLGRTLEETAALFEGEQQPQTLMQTGGEAATMSLAISPPSRGPGIWIEQEKSTVTDVVEMHDSPRSGRRQAHLASRQSTSLSRYDDSENGSDGARSEHSRSKIYEAV